MTNRADPQLSGSAAGTVEKSTDQSTAAVTNAPATSDRAKPKDSWDKADILGKRDAIDEIRLAHSPVRLEKVQHRVGQQQRDQERLAVAPEKGQHVGRKEPF